MAAEPPPPGRSPGAAAAEPAREAAKPAGATTGTPRRGGLAGHDEAGQLRSGPAARARPAASVIVLRPGRGAGGEPEILLVKRNPQARFMGGVWVFPGGAVDGGDGTGDRAHRAAAVRELLEEAGIGGLDPSALVKFSRWITPAELAVRFDTHFFLARIPDPSQEPRVDGRECVEHGWFAAQSALDAHAEGRIMLVFPTIRQLEQLRGFPSVEAAMEHARTHRVTAARPRVVLTGGVAGVVMPGEPGYDQA